MFVSHTDLFAFLDDELETANNNLIDLQEQERTKYFDDYHPEVPRPFRAVLDTLESQRKQTPGLDFSRRVLAKLCGSDSPPIYTSSRSLRVIHVAGTNGKGSTSGLIAQIMQRHGFQRCGLFTSPHLLSVRERIRIGGRLISHTEFIVLHGVVVRAVSECELTPSYFHTLTVMALIYFAWRSVEVCVLETGMGGTLDSTNVVPNPLVTVITSIGEDHTRVLGPTLLDIATSKAGIMKCGRPCVVGPLETDLLKIFEQRAQQLQCELIKIDSENLAADFKATNMAVAGAAAKIALKAMGVEARITSIHDNIGFLNHSRCRFESLTRSEIANAARALGITKDSPVSIVLDVGHNVSAMRALCPAIQSAVLASNARRISACVALSGKRSINIFDPISHHHLVQSIYYLPSSHPRCESVEYIKEGLQVRPAGRASTFLQESVHVWGSPDATLEGVVRIAFQEAADGMLLICGSFFPLAEVGKCLQICLW